MSLRRKYDRALMTTPQGASQFRMHSIRQAVTPDIYGSRSTFIVRVLTRPLPLSTSDFKAVMGAAKSKKALWENSKSARIVFMGRILVEGGDCYSPHLPIPDPCLVAPGNDEEQAGCIAKIASWHTKFFSSENFEGRIPDIGDKVKVTIMPGDFKYNLQYAFFDALESVGEGDEDDQNCRMRLRAKFNAFRSEKLGDILNIDYSLMPGGTGMVSAPGGHVPTGRLSFTRSEYEALVAPLKPLLDLIASKESGRHGANAANNGTCPPSGIAAGCRCPDPSCFQKYAKSGGSSATGLTLTTLTVGQIQQYQSSKAVPNWVPDKLFATGLYQIIPGTLRSVVRAGALRTGDLYNKANQDIAGVYLILKKAGGGALGKYLVGASDNEVSALDALAAEWAAFPLYTPTGGCAQGFSKYCKDKFNKARITLTAIQPVLRQVRQKLMPIVASNTSVQRLKTV